MFSSIAANSDAKSLIDFPRKMTIACNDFITRDSTDEGMTQ